MFRQIRHLAVVLVLAAGALTACGDDDPEERAPRAEAPGTTAAPPPPTVPAGEQLPAAELQELAVLFDDAPYSGGQTAPRLSKWITPSTQVFVEFDRFPPDQATEVTYVGVAVKGVFCAEAQPDRDGGSFTHLHRPDAPEYQQGHGGDPGVQGYWLSWMAVDSFQARDGRLIVPGIDYQFSPTPPPACGAQVPDAQFAAPDEGSLSKEDLDRFVAFFDDPILEGGQTAPRLSKWLNADVALFIQLDNTDPALATTIRYVGIYQRGVFCSSAQPHDFTHYHRLRAPEYQQGHGGQPGESEGFWLAWMSTDTFQTRDGRTVTPGIDRQFSLTPPPEC